MFWIYRIAATLGFVLLLPVLLFHPKLRCGYRYRFGFYPRNWLPAGPGPVIWFHGASAGDVLSLQPVLEQVKSRRSEAAIVLTTVTGSGMIVAERIQGVAARGYLPYDLPLFVRGAIRAIRPSLLVLEYAEVWPALIREARRFGAQVVIINGRFHEKALRRYRWLYRLIGNPLHEVSLLCVRDEREAGHAREIGADPGRIRVTGNTKFDAARRLSEERPAGLADIARALGVGGDSGPIWLAGSTHEGEEALLLAVFFALRQEFPTLRLVIAPRYVERAMAISALAQARGFSTALRSRGAGAEPVVLLDTVGELRAAYHLASIVFVGGSFVPRGGQNILEPAACGKVVLFGPSMANFRDVVPVLSGQGCWMVQTPAELQQKMSSLLGRPEELRALGERARRAASSLGGATQACAQAILELAQQGGVT